MKKLLPALVSLAVFALLVGVFGLKTRRQALREAMRPRPPIHDTHEQRTERRTRTREADARPRPTRIRETRAGRRREAIRGR